MPPYGCAAMVKLLLFAAAREAAGWRQVEMEAGTVGELLELASDRFGPDFEKLLPSCSVFVGDAPVPSARFWDVTVAHGADVAVLPPVSGGAHGDGPDGLVATGGHSLQTAPAKPLKVAVVTVSDRSAHGQRRDESGPAVAAVVQDAGWDLAGTATVPDDAEAIAEAIRAWADDAGAELVLTTGGTGLGPRDVTPEVTRALVDREVPGIPEVMRQAGMASTPLAALSRQVAGQRGHTLIVNLPGSPRAARECLRSVLVLLPHAVELIRGGEQ
jgi:molybdopterin adenylyltransferase